MENRRTQERSLLDGLKGVVPFDQVDNACEIQFVSTEIKLSHIDEGSCKGKQMRKMRRKKKRKNANQFFQGRRRVHFQTDSMW